VKTFLDTNLCLSCVSYLNLIKGVFRRDIWHLLSLNFITLFTLDQTYVGVNLDLLVRQSAQEKLS